MNTSQRVVNTPEFYLWARKYRSLIAVPQFFEGYRRLFSRSGHAPGRNFLIGSELLREDEVKWCKVLKWLLDPSSCERSAVALQQRLLAGYPELRGAIPLVAGREVDDREGNRVDIVLSNSKWFVVIEAKVNAPPDEQQLLRYPASPLRANRDFRGLFLTPDGAPLRAKIKAQRWTPIAWKEISRILLLQEAEGSSPGSLRWRMVAEDFAHVISEFYTRME